VKAIALSAVIILTIVGVSVWREVSAWQECRATPHTFLYCARVLGG
jgi:hypothetical protein